MSRSLSKLVAAVALGAALAGLTVAADEKKDDTKKPEKKTEKKDETKAPDWSGYVTATTMTGEVTKVESDGFTLTVPKGPAGAGGRPKSDKVKLTFAEAGLVRWKTLPVKLDEKGKRVQYTDKELKELKSPQGAPFFAAERSDLQLGHLVEVTLVRSKEIPAAKATLQDMLVKYAVIVGSNPVTGPSGGARKGEKKGEEKKKDKN